MADYIYLLQNRLSPAQRSALEAVRDAARAHGMPVFLVGGAVRDLTSGAPVRDLDFAMQGEVLPLGENLQSAGGILAGENPVLGSQFWLFRGGVRVELGPTLTVSFPKPGQAETQPATILDDLRRRDFTVNAMAISLNEGSYGLLLDPLNGVADAENRELRLVSNYGFIEQPALLFRAARLSERLGWNLEERTQSRYETAKEEGYVAALPAWDRGYEIEEVFHEEDPIGAWEHLEAEGWGEALFPTLQPDGADTDGMERVRELAGQMEQLGIHTNTSPVLFPLITAKLSLPDQEELKSLFPRQGFRQQIDSLETRGKELASQLTGKSAATPSETWKLLFAAEPEVVLWTAANTRTPAVQSKLKNFLNEWPQMRQRIPYALMQEMRITPELPDYAQLLEDLFFALIDGKLATPEATRSFLEPFSPPAPVVQAAPRRKAAKSARGRSRKVQEPVASESDEEEETLAADQDDPDADRTSDTSGDDDDEDIETEEDADESDESPSVPAPPTKAAKGTKASAKLAAPQVTAPEPAKAQAPVPAKTAAKPEVPSRKPAVKDGPEKPATGDVAKKAAPAKSAAPIAALKKSASAEVELPAKKMAAPLKSAVKKPATPSKAPEKLAAKRAVVAPAKAVAATKKTATAPAKTVVVVPGKKTASKQAAAPAKAATGRAAVATKTPVKVPAKSPAPALSAKKAVAKKVAAKTKKR